MEFKDYYSLLGVDRAAPKDELKRAYRRLARKYHPDVSSEPNAEERFKEVNEAYEVLKDDDKRAAYDRFGENWQAGQDFQPPPDWDADPVFRRAHGSAGGPHSAQGFSDFFEAMFGAGGERGQPRGDHGPAGFAEARFDGGDINAQITISIEDAYRGATRQIALDVPEADAQGRLVRQRRTLNVTIPKGILAGQRIRLEDQGEPGFGRGARRGDLYLSVNFEPHRIYRAQKRDIHIDLPVSPAEAVLGGTVQTPTLGGVVDLKIPPGSGTGTRLRLKNRGLPGGSAGSAAGDQYVTLKITVPADSSERARELYRQLLQEEAAFKPRDSMGV